ncbi:MAG: phosphoenolpyruvate carboxylase [Candidatus Jordarchaeales archaeon]
MRVPAVMITQNPDFASTYVPLSEEPDEAVMFLSPADEGGHGFDELMVDFEGKMTPCNQVVSIVSRLAEKGVLQSTRVKVTPRMPAGNAAGLRRTSILHSIIEANYIAHQYFGSNIVEEAVYPVVNGDVRSLVRLETNFNIIKNYIVENENMQRTVDVEDLRLIPLLDELNLMLNAAAIASSYISAHEIMHSQGEIEKLRIYLSRELISTKFGMVSSVLTIRLALSKLREISESSSIPVYPILEFSSLPLRGNIGHGQKDLILKTYSGISTVALSPSVVYDSEGKRTPNLVKLLKEELHGKRNLPEFSEEEETQIKEMTAVFAHEYIKTISKASKVLEKLAPLVPDRREAVVNKAVEVASKELECLKFGAKASTPEPFSIPPPVKYTALMYTLGVPPELIGVGRAINILEKKMKNAIEHLLDFYPSLETDISSSWRCLCLDAARKVFPEQFISDIAEDVKFIKDFLSPEEECSLPHRAITMMFSEYAALKSMHEGSLRNSELKEFVRDGGVEEVARQLILHGGRIRRALG